MTNKYTLQKICLSQLTTLQNANCMLQMMHSQFGRLLYNEVLCWIGKKHCKNLLNGSNCCISRAAVFRWHKKSRKSKFTKKLMTTPFMIPRISSILIRFLLARVLWRDLEQVQGEFSLQKARTLPLSPVALESTSSQFYPGNQLIDTNGHQKYPSATLQSRHCTLRVLVVPKAEGESQGQSFWKHWEKKGSYVKGRGHLHIGGLSWGLHEVAGALQQVLWSRRRLFWRWSVFSTFFK